MYAVECGVLSMGSMLTFLLDITTKRLMIRYKKIFISLTQSRLLLFSLSDLKLCRMFSFTA